MTAQKPKAKKAAQPSGEKAPAMDVTVTTIKLKDLVAQVAEATGGNKPTVKRVIEETLAAMGAALQGGSNLAVPPLGRLRVAKVTAGVLTLKLRLADATQGSVLAEDDEES